MKNERITPLCNILCALLLVVMLVMQFQPFWTCAGCSSHKGVEQDVSIADYLWRPNQHKTITKEMTELYRDIYGDDFRDSNGKKAKFRANDILPATLTVFLGSVVGILCCVFLRKKFFVAAIPVVVGVAGVLGYTSYPALQVGYNWQTHRIIAAVVAFVAAICLLLGSVLFIQKKRDGIKIKAEVSE